jgi:transposase InsO family protein
MQPSDIPDRPWQIAATDIFHWNNTDYILLVDYYSRYFEVSMLPDTKSSTVIDKLKGFLSRHGIVQTLVSDNARQYTSQEFHEFAKKWDFEHRTSSPGYPQSNGLGERTVQTIKALFTKAKQAGTDPYLSLLEYRNSPLACGKSPAQLLMSRQLRSILPVTSNQLDPQVPLKSHVKSKISQNKGRSKVYYDRSAHPLSPLQIGDSVRIRQGKLWKPATVSQMVNNRSFIVTTQDGSTYRRNRRHLLKTNENQSPCRQLQFPNVTQMTQNTPMISPKTATASNNNTVKCYVNTNNNVDLSNSEKSENNDTTFYTTRSGRSIKPPVKFDL